MFGSRKVLSCLLVLALFALTAPVVALADGGSAGDQQYTDPLSGVKSPTKTTSTTPAAPQTPSTSTSSSPPPTSTTTPPTSSTPSEPTATTAASPTTGTGTGTSTGTSTLSAGSARQLPYTGYNGGLAAAIGFVLVLGGIGLRFKLRRA